MDNADISKLIDMLSKMDKKDLEAGIARANEVLKNNSNEDILNKIKKM